MAIWYILWSFGIFFPVLVFCTKKNLATLPERKKKSKHIFGMAPKFKFQIFFAKTASAKFSVTSTGLPM
jgi:hypothetical protein